MDCYSTTVPNGSTVLVLVHGIENTNIFYGSIFQKSSKICQISIFEQLSFHTKN